MRINLQPDYATLPPGSCDRVVAWLKESNIEARNVPQRESYVIKGEGTDWWLVARRYVRNTKGEKMLNAIGTSYCKTIQITVRVTQPPDFLLPEGVRS